MRRIDKRDIPTIISYTPGLYAKDIDGTYIRCARKYERRFRLDTSSHIDNLELENERFKPVSIIKSTGLSLKTQYLTLINLLPKHIKDDLKKYKYLYVDPDSNAILTDEFPSQVKEEYKYGNPYSEEKFEVIGCVNLELA